MLKAAELDGPAFLELLRRGDQAAFHRLVRRYHGALVGTAAAIIGSRAQAEEVVQDAWIAILNNIGRFEGRSALSSWIFAIVLNRARTRATTEGRLVALPAGMDGLETGERAVPLTEFAADGHWRDMPRLWEELDPERVVSGRQLWAHVQEAIELLPAGQKAVVILRDMEAKDAEETCALLGITAENQRVLLHRGRGRLRAAIDALMAEPGRKPVATTAAPATRRNNAAGRLERRMLRWAAELQSASKTISWAPCHSTILPSVARFSMPSTMVRKWLPASWPSLLANCTPP